jgi:hypothetical protein
MQFRNGTGRLLGLSRFHKYWAVICICPEQLFLTEKLRGKVIASPTPFAKTV